MICLLI